MYIALFSLGKCKVCRNLHLKNLIVEFIRNELFVSMSEILFLTVLLTHPVF